MSDSRIDVGLLTECIRRWGWYKGARVAETAHAWLFCEAELGHVPATMEFVRWWPLPERTVLRRLRDARECLVELPADGLAPGLVRLLGSAEVESASPGRSAGVAPAR